MEGFPVKIPCGTYHVGLDSDSLKKLEMLIEPDLDIRWFFNCTPSHEVHTNGFAISGRLVTLDEFNLFISETGYLTQAEEEGWGWTWDDGWEKCGGLNWRKPFKGVANSIYADHHENIPVLQASWNDAAAYCRWRRSRGDACRLPTECEWEMFAEFTGYPSAVNSGKPVNDLIRNELDLIRVLAEKSSDSGGYQQGLLWEWVEDWFVSYPGGLPNREFGTTYKVLRGGSLGSNNLQRIKEFRFRRCPTARSPFYGFRCIEG